MRVEIDTQYIEALKKLYPDKAAAGNPYLIQSFISEKLNLPAPKSPAEKIRAVRKREKRRK